MRYHRNDVETEVRLLKPNAAGYTDAQTRWNKET